MRVAPSSYYRHITAFILRSLARRILRRPLTQHPADIHQHADLLGPRMPKTEQADGANPQAIALATSIQTSQTGQVTEMTQMLQNL